VQSFTVCNHRIKAKSKLSFFAYSPCKKKEAGKKAHILFHTCESGWIKVNDTGLEIAKCLNDVVAEPA